MSNDWASAVDPSTPLTVSELRDVTSDREAIPSFAEAALDQGTECDFAVEWLAAVETNICPLCDNRTAEGSATETEASGDPAYKIHCTECEVTSVIQV